MSAERQQIEQGYLQRILVNGTKPFRYRSGIRTLLGLPSTLDARIAHPLPLPSAGFNYLRNAAINEAEVGAPRVFSESIRPETGKPEAPARFQRQESVVSRMEGPASARHSLVTPGAPRPTAFDRKIERPEVAASEAEELRIDIPGASQREVRFSALAPQPKDAVPVQAVQQKGSETLQNISQNNILQNKEPSSFPAPDRATATTSGKMPVETPSRLSGRADNSVPPSPHPIREPAALKRANLNAMQSHPLGQNAGRPVPLAAQLVGEAAPNQIGSARPPSRAAEWDKLLKGPTKAPTKVSTNVPTAGPTEAPTLRPAADAQIEKIRRGTSASMLKRRELREPEVQESQSPSPGRPPERDRPVGATPQPIVIVNRPQAQRQSTPAFWERSYLSRLFRVRPLR